MKKTTIFLIVIIAIILVLFFGQNKTSQKKSIEDWGLTVVNDGDYLTIDTDSGKISVYSCVVFKSESNEYEYYLDVAKENKILGKSYYNAQTYRFYKLDEFDKRENLEDKTIVTYRGDNMVLMGIVPNDCKEIYADDMKFETQERKLAFDGEEYNFIFYYGVFQKNFEPKTIYCIDGNNNRIEFNPADIE